MPGLRRGVGEEGHGVRDGLGAGGVMFAHPHLVVPQPVEELDHLEIALIGVQRVLTRQGVERGHEDAELQTGHRLNSFDVTDVMPAHRPPPQCNVGVRIRYTLSVQESVR